jgi:hypothetical protein
MDRRVIAACCGILAWGGVAAADPLPALSLELREPAFREPRIMIATSMPPQFEILLDRDMPTPGWTFVVDGVSVDEDGGRLVADVSEIGPEGVVTQIITAMTCRIPLGRLSRGRYVLEIRLRRGAMGPHAPVQAFVLDAR